MLRHLHSILLFVGVALFWHQKAALAVLANASNPAMQINWWEIPVTVLLTLWASYRISRNDSTVVHRIMLASILIIVMMCVMPVMLTLSDLGAFLFAAATIICVVFFRDFLPKGDY